MSTKTTQWDLQCNKPAESRAIQTEALNHLTELVRDVCTRLAGPTMLQVDGHGSDRISAIAVYSHGSDEPLLRLAPVSRKRADGIGLRMDISGRDDLVDAVQEAIDTRRPASAREAASEQ